MREAHRGRAEGLRMVIAWDRGMFWHIDCEKDSHSGIMKEVRVDETGGLTS